MPTVIRYRWRYYDEARRRYFVTRYHCTEEQICVEHADATPVEATRQLLDLTEHWLANSTGVFLRPPSDDNSEMCGLYAMFGPSSRHREYFAVDAWPEFPERYKIPPASLAPIIRQAPDGRRVADLLRWGLIPHWAKDETIARKLINARGETVADKPSFRSAYRRRRCIVPASGFYEWQAVPGQNWKQPYYFTTTSGESMAMGGLWESWTNPNGELIRTYCIITGEANALMAPIHDRMPVILPRDTWTAWLDPATDSARIAPLLVPADTSTMTAWPVSRKISSRGDDGPDLVARIDQ